MSTLLANSPAQSQDAEWEATRIGRFTASVIGKLMTPPKSMPFALALEAHANGVTCGIEPYSILKSGPRKGQQVESKGFASAMMEAMDEAGFIVFGDTALSLIASKAAERMGQRPAPQVRTKSMDRGSLLEHAARILLSRYWKPIDGVSFQPYGENGGATPDGYIPSDESTWQVKCPEDPGDLMLFANAVPDGDFAALESWNKVYAWQVMMEAKASGCKYATFSLFTDRLPIHTITDLEREEVQVVMDAVAYKMGEALNYPIWYKYETNGFAHVARRFELTQQRSDRIDRVLASAEDECERLQLLMQ